MQRQWRFSVLVALGASLLPWLDSRMGVLAAVVGDYAVHAVGLKAASILSVLSATAVWVLLKRPSVIIAGSGLFLSFAACIWASLLRSGVATHSSFGGWGEAVYIVILNTFVFGSAAAVKCFVVPSSRPALHVSLGATTRPVPIHRRTDKTVFISYRRTAAAWAQLIYQDLTQHGFDVFHDTQNIASGGFADVIFENIKRRAPFLVLLTPAALERCTEPSDLFRREIETALESRRNIVPILLDGFEFSLTATGQQPTEPLAPLKQYNALTVYAAYFPEAMAKLRDRFLSVPLETVLHPLSESTATIVNREQ